MNEEARDNIEDDDFEEVVARFENMIDSNNSEYFDVFEIEGIIDQYLEDGNIKFAAKAVQCGLLIHPDSIPIKIRQAQILMHEGKIDESLDLILLVEKIETNNPDIYLTKGAIFLQKGVLKSAEKAYETALRMPIDELDETLYNIGISFGQEGEVTLALKYLEMAYEANPQNEIVLYELGYYYDKDGQFEKSIELYNKYLDIDPFNHSVWYNIGITYNRMGLFNKAIEAYDYALIINESFLHAHFNKANALANSNQFVEAIECYQSYLQADQTNDDAHCYLAECFLNTEQYSDAFSHYQKAIELNDANASAWYGSGLISWSEGELPKALEFFSKAISLEQENPDFWAMFAKVHAEMDAIDDAIEAFEMATMLDPESIENWLSYSEMFYDIEDNDRAIEVLKTATKINKSNAYLNYRLTAYLLDKNEELEAACHFERALKIDNSIQNELFEFYPEASKIEAIKKLVTQYQSMKF